MAYGKVKKAVKRCECGAEMFKWNTVGEECSRCAGKGKEIFGYVSAAEFEGEGMEYERGEEKLEGPNVKVEGPCLGCIQLRNENAQLLVRVKELEDRISSEGVLQELDTCPVSNKDTGARVCLVCGESLGDTRKKNFCSGACRMKATRAKRNKGKDKGRMVGGKEDGS